MGGDYPDGAEEVWLGMGCFWGAERLWWQHAGVWVTAVGYAGGPPSPGPAPSYEAVCTGATGHAEVVKVVYQPQALPLEALLARFFEAHDPTQGMRQGNDRGSQYRSAIYGTAPQLRCAREVAAAYQRRLTAAGFGPITTELAERRVFYPAEAYHQQYLAKNPGGYCGLAGTGVTCG